MAEPWNWTRGRLNAAVWRIRDKQPYEVRCHPDALGVVGRQQYDMGHPMTYVRWWSMEKGRTMMIPVFGDFNCPRDQVCVVP